jgi:hypothetical protein
MKRTRRRHMKQNRTRRRQLEEEQNYEKKA